MAAASYEAALRIAETLNAAEQLRLIQQLANLVSQANVPDAKSSILELEGLGSDLWSQMDAQEYVRRERSSWNG